MFNFKNDYSKIAHKNILEAMLKYSDESYVGYGLDEHSKNAANLIKKHLNCDCDIHFLVGGTSANKTVIAHTLKPYEAVISVKTGHICVHETGAIEATGHKIITVDGENGKITPEEIEQVVLTHTDEHMVLPRLVYITQATEIGTLYTKEELINIKNMCDKHNLYLFLDGARLAVALDKSDITLEVLAKYTDVFYIGGTKNGALLGEAVVITNDDIKKSFRFSIKQNGGMYAKGFVAGIQFEELFKDELYFKLGHNSNLMAEKLANALTNLGIKLEYECVTNQLFVRVDNKLYEKLHDIVLFELWEDKGESKVIRFVTNYSTKEEEIDEFSTKLEELMR
jgi:threonine aldolase